VVTKSNGGRIVNAKLIIATGKNAGRSVTLKREKLLIGRAEECDIRPLSEDVSRRHCAVHRGEDDVWVEDLRSRNGTFVNGRRIEERTRVDTGDLIRVGTLELKVSCEREVSLETEEDVSRLLMGGDPPIGMHDTTRSLKPPAELVAGTPESPSNGAAAAASQAAQAGSNPDDSARLKNRSVVLEEILQSRQKPGNLPKSGGKPDTSSRDAAAEALRKFFGQR
jgi:predicted component of type VI protein secretion system